MALHALLYVSRARVTGEAAEAAVAEIVRVSRPRNDALQVTGALLFSGAHFAQWLEGSRAGVDELMHSITRDPRHADVSILQADDAPARRFPQWSLAYSGRSTFIDRVLAAEPEGAPPGSDARARRILTLLEGFAAR